MKPADIKSWDTLSQVRLDAEKALSEHNAALEKLYRNGSPIYSNEIMREHQVKARATLTAALDRCQERAAAFQERARAAAVGRDEPYTWLSDEELQRAALLRPFIAEDVAAAGPDGLRTLELQVRTGRRQVDRVQAWLLMREAQRLELPIFAFEAEAMPAHLTKAETEAKEAETLINHIAEARPEYQENIHRNILGQANWEATGQPLGQ